MCTVKLNYNKFWAAKNIIYILSIKINFYKTFSLTSIPVDIVFQFIYSFSVYLWGRLTELWSNWTLGPANTVNEVDDMKQHLKIRLDNIEN